MKHIRTRLFGITLSFIMLISLLPVTALAGEAAWNGTTVDTSWYNTSWYNTSATEFTISDSADLAGLAKLVNEGNNFSGKTIKLGADIDLGGKEWTPIGNSTNSFKGVFEGNKHTISNLFINSPTKSNIGLFGVTQSGEVKNFILKNAKVTGYLDVGAVAGTPYTSKYTNITVTGLIQVNGFSYVGGAFGKNAYDDLTNVDVTGDEGSYVKADSVEGTIAYRTYVGGLVGFMGEGSHTVSACDVKIDVTGSTCDVGGILGILHYGNTLKDCTYAGSLTLTNPGEPEDTEFGALVGTIHNGGTTAVTTINGCTATVEKADFGGQDVTETIAGWGTFYNAVTGSGNTGSVTASATVNDKDVTADNNVAKIGDQGYTTLAAAIEAANQAADGSNVTVTITKSGEYDPFTITRANVTVQAAKGVNATIKVSDDTMKTTQKGVTLKNLAFVTEDGSTILNYNIADALTLDGCTFTNNSKTINGTTALYIHQPNITITGCTFQNFERGYYTCGDGHAAGAMTFTNNEFTNVRVPIDGYWGKPAGTNTDITITGNTIDPGDWGTAYLQLWDYAQYQHWLNGKESELNPEGETALNATISGNTYKGDVVIYKTHCDWFSKSNVTIEDTGVKVVDRKLIVLKNVTEDDTVTVTNADGSPITAFNDSTEMRKVGDKYVIYSLSEGDYKVHVTHKADESGTSIVTSTELTVTKPVLNETQPLEIPLLEDDAKYVAKIVGGEKYTSLAAAIDAAKKGGTVELLQNVTIDTWNQVWDAKDLTINGNGHTVTVKKIESKGNGDYLFYGAENLNVSNLTVNLPDGDSGFSMVSGKLEGVTVNGGVYAVATGAAPARQKVEIKNCTFTGQSEMAIYTQENGNAANTVIDGCTFNSERAVILRNNEQFTNNTVKGSAGVTIYSNATATVTGNTFTEGSRLKVYKTKSTIERNKLLGNVVLDESVPENNNEISLDKNYWGKGRTPSSVLGKDASKVDGGKTEYYVHPSMNPEDLNTYVPSTGGGSSSSGDYLITVDKTTGGKVTVNPGRADKGDEVTITVKPNDGYVLDELTVTAKDGGSVKLTWKDDNKYTFTMPGSQITIKATFKAAESSALDNFTDVNSNAWYADAVEFVIEEGLMTGTSDTTFAPDTSMSRAMIWTVLAAYNGANTSGGNPWYAPSQQWAMINGVSDGSAPNGSITREQLAVMLWRAAGSPSTSKNLTGYADANAVSDWAVEALAWAVDNGIISGMSGSSLAPQNTATRAQVAVMLMQFVECMDA